MGGQKGVFFSWDGLKIKRGPRKHVFRFSEQPTAADLETALTQLIDRALDNPVEKYLAIEASLALADKKTKKPGI